MRLAALTIAFVVLTVSGSFAKLLMAPYLQAPTTTSAYVMVECDAQDTVIVRFGPDTNYGQFARTDTIVQTTASTYVHRILLQGLSPNTLYHYRAEQGTVFSNDSYFRTAVPQGFPFRIAWMADSRTGSTIYDSIMTRMAATQPLIALFGGDLAVDPTYGAWKSEFFRPPQATFGARVPWVNAAGNHEAWSTNTQAFTCGPAGSGPHGYFSFDCGDLHVLVLNSELPLKPGTAQYAFADNDLAGSTQLWKLVMLHKPAYCSGGHNEDEDVKALTTGVFEKRGVDAVFAGHSHFYQHNVVNAIHHMVIGAAGAPLYSPTSASYTIKSAKEYNWATIDVTPATFRIAVFNERGTPLDTVILAKEGVAYDAQLARIARDTLRITTRTRNPLAHALRVTATLRNGAGAFIDSLSLKDDGAHGDGAAGDGLFGQFYVPPQDAMIYLSVRTDDLTLGISSLQRDVANILFTRGAAITVDARQVDLGTIHKSIARYDTTFLAKNTGFIADSLTVSVDPVNVVPDSAVAAFPVQFGLVPGESLKVTFRIRPSLLPPQSYTAQVILESKYAYGQNRFEKNYRFEIVTTPTSSSPPVVPKQFALYQNYPNPFNPSTTITFGIPSEAHVRLEVYNPLGEKVATVVNDHRAAGYYSEEFNATNLANGLYVYRLQAGAFVKSKKLVLIK